MNFKNKMTLIAIVLAVVLVASFFFYPLRSYVVMSLYSDYNSNVSLLRNNGFSIKIKGGLSTLKKDWYPFVNTYDSSDEFSSYIGKDLSLNVLYNFGAFEGKSSSFYNEDSDYFASFYGAYVISYINDAEDIYGFSEDGLNIDEIIKVPEFDYKYLVVNDLGCDSPVFEVLEYSTKENVSYIGYDGWMEIDAKVISNSPSHIFKEEKAGYIQYGLPINNDKDDFFEIELYGRLYARYFEEYESTVVLYIISATENTVKECDSDILSKTKIENE